jgi:hypothetical protein
VFNGANKVVDNGDVNDSSGGSSLTLNGSHTALAAAVDLVITISSNSDAEDVSFAITYTRVTGAIS